MAFAVTGLCYSDLDVYHRQNLQAVCLAGRQFCVGAGFAGAVVQSGAHPRNGDLELRCHQAGTGAFAVTFWGMLPIRWNMANGKAAFGSRRQYSALSPLRKRGRWR